MQETRHILQFSEIGGVRRNPSTIENGKFTKYNNTTGKFDYVCVGDGGNSDINLSFFTTLVTNILEGIGTDTFLSSINRVGDSGQFTMSNGTNLYLPLGALAWEDEVEATLTLPGDTKVLYDNNDSIGGSPNFTYNYTSNRLQFKDSSIAFTLGTEGPTYKEGLKYNGLYSWSVGNGVFSNKSGEYNFTGGYKAGNNLGSTSLRNTVIGPFAGELLASDSIGNVLYGPYAGRYETGNNKFFLDNKDHSDTATARTSSFLYADLDVERRLYIRDRLSVEKEGKFGTSGLLDEEGEYGMYQMSAASGGNPQWHDGTEWKDFANSINTYLNDYDLTGSNLTLILSDLSEVGPIDLSGINTTTFATSPASPSTGQTATSNYGYIQISNSSFINNEGFTYKAGLRWTDTTKELFIPGALNIASLTNDSGLSNTSVWSDGDHAYIKLNGVSIQIDNEELPEEGIDGVNIGGATYEFFKQRVDDNLEFRTFQSMPIGANNPNDRLKIGYSTTGDAIFIGTNAERNRLDTVVDSAFSDVTIDRDNSGETLLMRALRPGTGVTLTQHEEYILIDATGAGGGEVNTASNLGAGIEFWAYKNGADLEFFTLDTSDPRIVLTQATDRVTDQENLIDLDLGFASADAAVVGAGEASLKSTITGTGVTGDLYTFTYKKLTSPLGSVTIAETATEIQLEAGSTAATGTNLGAGVDIYVDSSAPAFEFKTLNTAGLNGHIDITPNADNETIDFSVDDNIIDFLGAGEQLFTIDDDGWTINLLGISVATGSGLTITPDTTDLTIDQPILIPKFSFLTTPVFTPGTPATQGLLEFKTNYNADVREGDSLTATTMFTLNVGEGLSYNSSTNTLSSTAGGVTATEDHYLQEVGISTVGTNYVLSFTVDTPTSSDAITVADLSIPIYQLPIADYTNYLGATGVLGGVKIEQFTAGWALGNTVPLALNKLTGTISADKLSVSYQVQNSLHDEDNLGATLDIPPSTELNINTLRTQARANIGAAYVNGKVDEDFTAKDLVVEDILTAADTSKVHSIGALRNKNNGIYSSGTSVVIAPNAQAFDEDEARVEVTTTGTKIYIYDGTPLEVYNASTGIKMMKLVGGDLYISGNIYANADIQAFAGKTL